MRADTISRTDDVCPAPPGDVVRTFGEMADHGLHWAVLADSRGGSDSLLRLGNAPPRARDHVRLASVSKPLIGAVYLDLRKRGALAASDAVADYLPNLCRELPDLTIKDLATHASGLRDALEDATFRKQVNMGVERPMPLDAVLEASLALPRDTDRPRYANINAILLAAVCERATAQSIDALVHRLLPDISGLALPNDGALPVPRAKGWRWGKGPGRIEYGRTLFEATTYNAAWSGAAGGFVIRAGGLPRLGRVFEVIDRRLEAEEFSRHVEGDYMALCQSQNEWLCHAGDLPGYSCWAGREMTSGRSVAVAAGMCWIPGLGNPAERLARCLCEATEISAAET